MAFRIYALDRYEIALSELEKTEQKRVDRLIRQIAENGMLVGKQIRRPFFREKRLNGNRLYFLVYLKWNTILLATISDKKQQPETIEWIIQNLDNLQQFVEKKLKEDGVIV